VKKAIVILKHRWKHKFIRDFFSEYDEVVVNLDCRLLSYTSDVDFFFWASDIDNDFYKHYAQHDNVYLMEDGFFRSVGLGADHMRPLSLVFDQSGIYYDSSCPSDLELILTSLDLDCYLKKQSLDLIESINRLKVNKYNLVSDQEYLLQNIFQSNPQHFF
jgi:capsular polysaccharide export protein